MVDTFEAILLWLVALIAYCGCQIALVARASYQAENPPRSNVEGMLTLVSVLATWFAGIICFMAVFVYPLFLLAVTLSR